MFCHLNISWRRILRINWPIRVQTSEHRCRLYASARPGFGPHTPAAPINSQNPAPTNVQNENSLRRLRPAQQLPAGESGPAVSAALGIMGMTSTSSPSLHPYLRSAIAAT